MIILNIWKNQSHVPNHQQENKYKSNSARGCHKTFEICSQSCSLFDSSVVQAMAGAQQQSLQMSTIPKAWQ